MLFSIGDIVRYRHEYSPYGNGVPEELDGQLFKVTSLMESYNERSRDLEPPVVLILHSQTGEQYACHTDLLELIFRI